MTRYLTPDPRLTETSVLGTPASVGSAAGHLCCALIIGGLAAVALRAPVPDMVQVALAGPVTASWLRVALALVLAGVAWAAVRRATAAMGRRGRIVALRDRLVLAHPATGRIDQAIPYLTIAAIRQSRWAVTLTLTTGARVTLIKAPSTAGAAGRLFDLVAQQVSAARTGHPLAI